MGVSLRLLDLFCGAGGASKGYSQHFDDIVGVDIRPQPKYPYRFIQHDASEFRIDGYDLVHASPPCIDHSRTRFLFNEPEGSGWLLEHTLERAIYQGVCYVVENVMDATVPNHPHQFTLCGASLGPWLVKEGGWFNQNHRKFWCNFPVNAPDCMCATARAAGMRVAPIMRSAGTPKIQGQQLLKEIDWMTLKEMKQALPPYFTRFIAREFLKFRGIPF